MSKKKIIILAGVPGAGKGTQGTVLSRELSLPHISTGDILRNIMAKNTEESKVLSEFMEEGKLVPAELVNQIVKKFLLSDECRSGCILDGYPRNLDQAKFFVKNIDTEMVTIFFDLNDQIAIKRILGRFSCMNCGKIYNEYYDMPIEEGKCDDCGSSKFSTRADDCKKTVLSRLEEYRKETIPMIEYCKHNGKFFTIDASLPKNEIIREVESIVKKI